MATRNSRLIDREGSVKAPLGKLSLSVEQPLRDRVKRIAFESRVAESSIVEIALQKYFGDASDEQIAAKLTRAGARLRRR